MEEAKKDEQKNLVEDIVSPTVAVATEDMTVAEATDYLRQFVADTDNLPYIYLVDGTDDDGKPIANSRLVGVVTVLELLFHDDDKKLSEFAQQSTISVSPDEDQKTVATLTEKHDLLALPVIDKDGRLLGTVTADDLVSVAEGDSVGEGSQEEGPKTLNSDTAGDEILTILRKIGNGIRWLLPQNLSWMAIWLGTSLAVYIGQINLFAYMQEFEWGEVPRWGELLSFSLSIMQFSLLILPFIFLTIRAGVVRSIELSTGTSCLAPSGFVRYTAAIVIAIAHAFLSYVIIILSFAAMEGATNFTDFMSDFARNFNDLSLLIFTPLLFALLLCALFAAWRVGANIKAHKKGLAIRPGRAAAAAMLVFTLFFAGFTYPAAHLWMVQMELQEELMGDEWGEEWGEEWFEGEEDWGNDVIDLGDFDLEGINFEDDALYLDELLGVEDFGEVEIE